MSTEEEKILDKKQTENTGKIGIKIPWWIAYPILIIIGSFLVYIMYRGYINPETQDISIEVENLPEKIPSNEIIIEVDENEVKLEKIELSKNQIELKVGESADISAKLIPEDATNKDIKWKSSNPKIASIENGKIKGISEGETKIIVSSEDGNQQAVCTVKVKIINVKSVSMDERSVTLGAGQSYLIRATVSPSNATYKNITWTSSNENVITVNNGKIHAKSAGEAVVTASTREGKQASCTFKVTQTAPNNTIYYVTEEFNVRVGPGTNYTKLDTVSVNDEIEVLKETADWAKIRIKKNGIVGYTILKAYSTEKTYYIQNVPFIDQYALGYPTGCEAVAATMAAQYSGYNVSVATIVANTPTDTLGKRQETRTKEIQEEIINEETGETEIKTTTIEETVWIAENPFKYFVGHPTKYKNEGSYGCYAEPIAVSLKASGVPCTNISGCSIDTLYNHIQNGKPVIIWCRARAQDLTEGVTWQYPDGSGEYLEMVGEHCAVLIGYDENYVYLNDPAVGKGVKQPRWKFESNWYKLYSQAIIIN